VISKASYLKIGGRTLKFAIKYGDLPLMLRDCGVQEVLVKFKN